MKFLTDENFPIHYSVKADEPAYIVMNLVKQEYKLEKMHTVVETDKIRQRPIPSK